MQIADLRIENFRGIRIGHVRFCQHMVFVGPNYCGKTTFAYIEFIAKKGEGAGVMLRNAFR